MLLKSNNGGDEGTYKVFQSIFWWIMLLKRSTSWSSARTIHVSIHLLVDYASEGVAEQHNL